MKTLIIVQLLNLAFTAWQPTLLEGPLTADMRYFLEEADAPSTVENAAWRIGCAAIIAAYQDHMAYAPGANTAYWNEEFASEPLLCMDF